MHHLFGSKFLVDSLHSHGFCSSYSEVKKFELCAANTQGADIPGFTSDHVIQHVADNVDHNSRTLDGFNTFHGMGIVAAVTPAVKFQTPIPRVSIKASDITAKAKLTFTTSSL